MNFFERKHIPNPSLPARSRREAFSMIEVIIAIGIFAMSILAVIALLGAASRSTSEVLESSTASRIADGVRAELRQVPVYSSGGGDLFSMTSSPTNPLVLYATRDGERVLLGGGPGVTDPPADQPPNANPPDPRGIALRDRFFRIEVFRLEDTPTLDAEAWSGSEDLAAYIPLSLRVTWPYRVPIGPVRNPDVIDDDSSEEGDPDNQNVTIFNTAILRRE